MSDINKNLIENKKTSINNKHNQKQLIAVSFLMFSTNLAFGTNKGMVTTMMKQLGFINIGIMSMMLSSFSFMLTSLWIKAIIARVGPRVTMRIGSCGYLLILVYCLPSLICSNPKDCSAGKTQFIYIAILTAVFFLGCASAMIVISIGTFISTLSNDTSTKTKYSGLYTSIYKSSLIFGFIFSSFLLGLLEVSQQYLFYLLLSVFIFVAILLSTFLKQPNPDYGRKQKVEGTICEALIKAFKTQTKALSSGTMFPLLLSNLWQGANTTYHQSALPVYLQEIIVDSGRGVGFQYTLYSWCLILCTVAMLFAAQFGGKLAANVGIKRVFFVNYCIWIVTMLLASQLTLSYTWNTFNMILWFIFYMLYGGCIAILVTLTQSVAVVNYECQDRAGLTSIEVNGVRSFLYGFGQIVGWALTQITLSMNFSPFILQLIYIIWMALGAFSVLFFKGFSEDKKHTVEKKIKKYLEKHNHAFAINKTLFNYGTVDDFLKTYSIGKYFGKILKNYDSEKFNKHISKQKSEQELQNLKIKN